jgi:hypothetical protein
MLLFLKKPLNASYIELELDICKYTFRFKPAFNY